MRNFFLSSLTTPPRGNRSLAAQLGFCFVVIFVILIVISNTITSSYTAVLEQDRSNALQTTAVTSALAISHTTLKEGMKFPMPMSSYFSNGHTYNYIVNIYTKAGNSFLQVYTSTPSETVSAEQVTLDLDSSAEESYRKAFEKREAVVVARSDKTGSYVAGVAPVIGVDGTETGLVEVLMPASDFHYAEHGLSLSWFFTILSISAALSIVYYEIHKLLTTMFGQPDRQLPKIIRYGLSGCQSIAFFSAMACSMPPLVISSYLLNASKSGALPSYIPPAAVIILGGFLFALGFFGFSTLRMLFVRRFTTRISLITSIFAAFILLLISSVLSNVYLYLVLLLPIGFLLGMVFYFQREYRIYASRLGYEEFSERVIHSTQYTGYLLGACVGAVMSGMIFERFGQVAVSLICGCILFIVGIQALLFVQHCPPSSSPPLHLPNFLYALSSRKSGTYIWSCVMTSGIQLAFYFVFIPFFLNMLGLSIATISFYFILFTFVGNVLVRSLLKLFPNRMNMQGRIMSSAILQVTGLFILALFPTAKVLVITVILMGAALGLHEFRMLDYYKDMIREDKQALAREILEKGFSSGAVIGTIGYSVLFLSSNLRLSLLLFTILMAVLLFAYPLITLLYTPSRPNPSSMPAVNEYTKTNDPFEQYQEFPDYNQVPQYGDMVNHPAENEYQGEYPGQSLPPDNYNQVYGQQSPYNSYNPDEWEGGHPK